MIRYLIIITILFFSPLKTSAITVDITATVQGCNDGSIGIGEQCDGINLGGSSCTTLGFTAGALSCSSACTFNTSLCSTGTGGGSGGGGGGSGGSNNNPDTNVVFSGRAYPLSRVGILKDGQLVVTTIAGPDSIFTATISGLSRGDYTFSVYGEDKNSIRSNLFSFPIYITSGVTTKIGGIFIAPTIALDKKEVRRGDNISIFGQSTPSSQITININSEPQFFLTQPTDTTGAYLLNFDSSQLAYGDHSARSKSILENTITDFSKKLDFLVGDRNVFSSIKEFANIGTDTIKGDLNDDKKVNLIDFSIAAFWYKKTLTGNIVDKEKLHLNSDGKIDLVDFSIMAFHWTG